MNPLKTLGAKVSAFLSKVLDDLPEYDPSEDDFFCYQPKKSDYPVPKVGMVIGSRHWGEDYESYIVLRVSKVDDNLVMVRQLNTKDYKIPSAPREAKWSKLMMSFEVVSDQETPTNE